MFGPYPGLSAKASGSYSPAILQRKCKDAHYIARPYSTFNYPWYITAINKRRQGETSSIKVIADFQIFLSWLSLALNELPKMLRVQKKSIHKYQGFS